MVRLVTSAEEAERAAEAERAEMELSGYRTQIAFMQESLADLELAMEDRGWLTLSMQAAQEFTREGRRRAASLARILAIQNPLIKRGLGIRAGYIWGEGVQISAAEDEVNEVLQKFLDDNETTFGSSARVEAERSLGTDGDVFRALFTSPLTGRVRVRSIDPDEIEDIICNPEDRDETWFYLRVYNQNKAGVRYAGITNTEYEIKKVLYPALGFVPSARVKEIDGIEVRWDIPVQHIAVNRSGGRGFGIGDAYAAIFWARAYKEFLEDWAKLTKSLSRFAWRLTSSSKSRAAKAAQEAQRAADAVDIRGTSPAGATAVAAGSQLEAIPKSGATIDANSGKPIAGMVAAALGVPVTMLLADPGQTGARAVAETLDEPTSNEMNLRRQLWTSKDAELFDYVIDQAVKAPRGPLKGTITKDEYGREVITLAGDMDRTIDIDWPSLDKVSIEVIVKAIVEADSTNKVPPLTIARLLLVALGVDDVDEALKDLTDADGNFVDPQANAGDQAVDAFRRGEDPAEVL